MSEDAKLIPAGGIWRSGNSIPGLGRKVREQTSQGQELIDFHLTVMRGGFGARVAERQASANWLSDRGWGKAPDMLMVANMTDEQRASTAQLTTEQLFELLKRPKQHLDLSAQKARDEIVEGETLVKSDTSADD